jgi:cephalosporin hydroxylase
MHSYLTPVVQRLTVERFHLLYYGLHAEGGTWRDTYWMGVPLMKCPLDLWLYQEIVYRVRPAVIVETGTAYGGSALYLAHLCDLLGTGAVISVDFIERPGRPTHPRLTYLTGSSTDPAMLAQITARIPAGGTVMVILDSDHSRDHVLQELHVYGPLVTPDSYLIVEDTNLNGHPVMTTLGPGPAEALEEYLKIDRGFVVDTTMSKFLMTFNPRGYLRKVAI